MYRSIHTGMQGEAEGSVLLGTRPERTRASGRKSRDGMESKISATVFIGKLHTYTHTHTF